MAILTMSEVAGRLKEIAKRGKRVENKDLKILYEAGASSKEKAFFVLRKSIGTSAQRNKTRRKLKEIWRINKSKAGKPFDIIVIPKKDLSKVKNKDLEENFLSILRKAEIIK